MSQQQIDRIHRSKKYNRQFDKRGATAQQLKDLKFIEDYEQLDRSLNGNDGWYATLPRCENGAIDWRSCSERTIDAFSQQFNRFEQLSVRYNSLDQTYINNLRHHFANRYGYGGSF